MAGSVSATLATRISIDDMQAVQSLRGIRSQVQTLMNSWRAQNAMLESVGNHLGAAKAKYEGLGDAIKKQEEYIQKIKSSMETLDTSTTKGAEKYSQLEKQLSLAQKQLANFNAQQKRAESSMNYYASGMDKVKSSLREMTTSSNLMVEKLRAEGKQYQANYEQSRLYANQLSKMRRLRIDLVSQINRVGASEGEESAAYKRAVHSLESLDVQMAKTTAAQKKLNRSFSNSNPAIAKMRDNYEKVRGSISKIGGGVREAAGKIASGVSTAVTATAGLGAAFVVASKQASELQNTYQRTTNLLVTGGEKTAQATKAVSEMQRDGRKYSLEYGKSQREIADAYQDLIKRGDTSAQALGSMKSVIQASVASGDDLKDVTEVTSNVMESFGMKVDKAGNKLTSATEMTKRTKTAVNDLAYAADKTSTNFQALGVGMSYVGATAHGAGISLSETASAMGILSNNGLEADKAGTGLRKVINGLTSPTAAARTELSKLGLSTKDFVDKSGKLKSMSTIFGELNEKTSKLSKAQQASVFHTLFGATGQQAGQILAENAKQLHNLNKEVASSSKHNYVGELAQKNMGTAQAAMNRFKMVAQDVSMTLSSAVLPSVSKAAEAMARFADTKDFRSFVQVVGKGLGSVGNVFASVATYIGRNSKAFSSMGSSLAQIIGALGSGIWATFKGTMEGISKAILAAFGKKSTGNVAKDLANALAAIAKHKKAIKDIGEALAAMFIAKKVLGFASAITKVVSGIRDLGDAVKFVRRGGSILDAVSGLKGEKRLAARLGTAGKDLAKSAEDGAGSSKVNFLRRMFHKPDDLEAQAASNARAIANGAKKAALKGTIKGKFSFFKKLFAKTPAAEGDALATGTRLAAHIGNGLNIGIQAIDLGRALFEKGGGKKKFEDVGSSAGSMIGTGIGTALGGPVGGMVGGIIGQVAGKWGGALAHKAVGAWKKAGGWKGISHDISSWAHKTWRSTKSTFGKISHSVGSGLKKAGSSVGSFVAKHKKQLPLFFTGAAGAATMFAPKIAKATVSMNKKMARSLGNFISKHSKSWKKFWSNASKQTQKNSKTINTKATRMIKSLTKGFGNFIKKHTRSWKKFWKGAEDVVKKSKIGQFSKKLFDGMWKNISSAYERITKAVREGNAKQNKAVQDGSKKRIGLSNDEVNHVIRNSDRQLAVVVGNADKKFRQTVTAAQKKRNQVIAEANKEYYQDGTISKQQHDDLIAKANDTYHKNVATAEKRKQETVKRAQEEHAKVVAEANKQRDEHEGAAHGESDKVNNAYNSMVDRMAHIYNGIADGLNSILKKLDNKDKTIPHWNPRHYATGTSGTPHGGLAVVGEEGFELARNPKTGEIYPVGVDGEEIRYLDEDTQILPHDMSKNFAALAATLPHHKDGKNKDNFLEKAKDKLGDAMDLVTKGADKVLGALFKPWDAIKNFFHADTPIFTIEGVGKLIKDAAIKMFKGLFDKYSEEHSGGFGNIPDMKNSAELRDLVKAALEANGLSTSDGMIARVMRQIATESGGNAHAVQPGADPDHDGSGPALGLMQTKRSTFNAYKAPGHNDIFNAYDNLLAALNYAKHRYGPSLSFLGNGHGYANGGIADSPSIFGEAGPEMAIPLSSPKRGRAYELLGKVVSMFAADEQRAPETGNQDSRVEQLLEQNNVLMQTLIGIATGQLDAIKAGNGANNLQVQKGQFYTQFGQDQKLSNFQAF